MKTPVIVLFALTVSLAVGHLVEANNEPPPSLAKDLMRMLFGGAQRRAMASPHIAGGSEVEPHSHPHQVAVITRKSNITLLFCGGSLIAPQWILTAAHCVTEKIFWNASVIAVMGAHHLNKSEPGGQVIPAQRELIFESYDNVKITDDIALVQLKTPVILNDKVKIIRLPSLGLAQKDLRDTAVVMSGWGKYNSPQNEQSPFLRSASTYVLDSKMCSFILSGKQITNRMICSDGSEGVNGCAGDSGGPLVMTESDGEPTVIGVASFGYREGREPGYPTIFTRVDQYLGWIANHTGIKLRK